MDLSFLNASALIKQGGSNASISSPSPSKKHRSNKSHVSTTQDDKESSSVRISQSKQLRFDKKLGKSIQKTAVSVDETFVLSDDEIKRNEVFLIQCPAEFDCNLLEGINIPLSGRIDIEINEESSYYYELTSVPPDSRCTEFVFISGSADRSHLQAMTMNQRKLVIRRCRKLPKLLDNTSTQSVPPDVNELIGILQRPHMFGSSTKGKRQHHPVTPIQPNLPSSYMTPPHSSPSPSLTLLDSGRPFPRMEDIMPESFLQRFGISPNTYSSTPMEKQERRKKKGKERGAASETPRLFSQTEQISSETIDDVQGEETPVKKKKKKKRKKESDEINESSKCDTYKESTSMPQSMMSSGINISLDERIRGKKRKKKELKWEKNDELETSVTCESREEMERTVTHKKKKKDKKEKERGMQYDYLKSETCHKRPTDPGDSNDLTISHKKKKKKHKT